MQLTFHRLLSGRSTFGITSTFATWLAIMLRLFYQSCLLRCMKTQRAIGIGMDLPPFTIYMFADYPQNDTQHGL